MATSIMSLLETADNIELLVDRMWTGTSTFATEGITEIIADIIRIIIDGVKSIFGGGSSSGGGGGGGYSLGGGTSTFVPGSKPEKRKIYNPKTTDLLEDMPDLKVSGSKIGAFNLNGFGPEGEDVKTFSALLGISQAGIRQFTQPIFNNFEKSIKGIQKYAETIEDLAAGSSKAPASLVPGDGKESDYLAYYIPKVTKALSDLEHTGLFGSHIVRGKYERGTNNGNAMTTLRLFGGLFYVEERKIITTPEADRTIAESISGVLSVKVSAKKAPMKPSESVLRMGMSLAEYRTHIEKGAKQSADIYAQYESKSKLWDSTFSTLTKVIDNVEKLLSAEAEEGTTVEATVRRKIIVSALAAVKVVGKVLEDLLAAANALHVNMESIISPIEKAVNAKLERASKLEDHIESFEAFDEFMSS